jgi:hypothetical protein
MSKTQKRNEVIHCGRVKPISDNKLTGLRFQPNLPRTLRTKKRIHAQKIASAHKIHDPHLSLCLP